jgi:hypothetical protein
MKKKIAIGILSIIFIAITLLVITNNSSFMDSIIYNKIY